MEEAGAKVTWGLGYGEMPQEPFLGLHEPLTVGGICKGQQAFESSPGTSCITPAFSLGLPGSGPLMSQACFLIQVNEFKFVHAADGFAEWFL